VFETSVSLASEVQKSDLVNGGEGNRKNGEKKSRNAEVGLVGGGGKGRTS